MFLTIAVSSFALLLPFLSQSSATPIENRGASYETVKFITEWPTQFCAGSSYEISWTGGSGMYNAWQWVNYPGLPQSNPYPLGDQTAKSVTWQAPYWKDLHPHTSYSFSVLDAESSHPDSGWIAYSPNIPINHCV